MNGMRHRSRFLLAAASLCALLSLSAGAAMAGNKFLVKNGVAQDVNEDGDIVCTETQAEEIVVPPASASGNTFLVRDRDWFWTRDGKEDEAPRPNGMQETEIGWIYWLFINPDSDEALKGERKGLHLYSDYTKRYSFLPLDDVDTVNCIHFSPDGNRFLIEAPAEEILISLYTLADLKLHFSTRKGAATPLWADFARFVYSKYEPGTTRGAPEGYSDEWSSIYMYDVTTEEETLLKAATETCDYTVLYFNEDGDIVAYEDSVESPEGWADPENKVENKEIVVPMPAAG